MSKNESAPLLKSLKKTKDTQQVKNRGVTVRAPYHYGALSTAGYIQHPSVNSYIRIVNENPIEVRLSANESSDSQLPSCSSAVDLSIQTLSDISCTNDSARGTGDVSKASLFNNYVKRDRSTSIQSEPIYTRDPYAASAQWKRYQYYGRLAPGHNSVFRIPDHVVPPSFFYFLPFPPKKGQQSSLVTIFALWNTMMGTSLLSMPWAIQQAGFGLGIGLILFVGALAFYSAYRVLHSINHLPGGSDDVVEFSDVCRNYLGKAGEYAALLFSFVALLGALVVYYVLMANFSYSVIDYIYSFLISKSTFIPNDITILNRTYVDIICSEMPSFPLENTSNLFAPSPANITTPTWYNFLWNQTKSVPLWLVLITFPLISIKSPAFFAKLNALGTLSVLYLIAFVVYKAMSWGIHMDFTSLDPHFYIPEARIKFPALTGIGTLAFFIHNCVLTISHSQKHPENNSRDLFIAYLLVALTYLCVGITFYVSFPLAKSCISDNFLNNIPANDAMAFVGRIALFFQILSIFPLLVCIMRSQLMYALFGSIYPSTLHVFFLHVILLAICILFSMFLPHIGNIIRFSGALSGLAFIYTLPSLVHMLQCKQQNRLTITVIIVHVLIIAFGIANFLAQIILLLI